MKQTALLFFLSFVVTGYSQSLSLKPTNGKLTVQLDTFDYLIKRDTTSSGVVTLTLTPTSQVLKELTSELGSIDSEQKEVQDQLDLLQEKKKVLNRKKKEIESLIESLSKKKETARPVKPVKRKKKE